MCQSVIRPEIINVRAPYNKTKKIYTSNGRKVFEAITLLTPVSSFSVMVDKIDVVRIKLINTEPRGLTDTVKLIGRIIFLYSLSFEKPKDRAASIIPLSKRYSVLFL